MFEVTLQTSSSSLRGPRTPQTHLVILLSLFLTYTHRLTCFTVYILMISSLQCQNLPYFALSEMKRCRYVCVFCADIIKAHGLLAAAVYTHHQVCVCVSVCVFLCVYAHVHDRTG